MGLQLTCLNVSLTTASPLAFLNDSYILRALGTWSLDFIRPSSWPRTAPSSTAELAPWARYGSMGWHESPTKTKFDLSLTQESSSSPVTKEGGAIWSAYCDLLRIGGRVTYCASISTSLPCRPSPGTASGSGPSRQRWSSSPPHFQVVG